MGALRRTAIGAAITLASFVGGHNQIQTYRENQTPEFTEWAQAANKQDSIGSAYVSLINRLSTVWRDPESAVETQLEILASLQSTVADYAVAEARADSLAGRLDPVKEEKRNRSNNYSTLVLLTALAGTGIATWSGLDALDEYSRRKEDES